MSRFDENPETYHRELMDTPLGTPRVPRSREHAMRLPGCCLQTVRRNHEGRPERFGRLTRISDTEVVVTSYPEDKMLFGHRFVWYGTPEEYISEWECD